MNTELVLLVYHQLVCMSDSDEIQERFTAEQKRHPPLTPGPWNDAEHHPATHVNGHDRDPRTVHTDPYGRLIVHRDEPLKAASPADNRPKDTEKTLYRWNHVSDAEWVTWGYTARRIWADAMIKKYQKAVLW